MMATVAQKLKKGNLLSFIIQIFILLLQIVTNVKIFVDGIYMFENVLS